MTTFCPAPRASKLLALSLLTAALGCTDTPAVGGTQAALDVACAATADLPAGAWSCPAPATVECSDLPTTTLYVTETDDMRCADTSLQLGNSGPWSPGTTQPVTVVADGQQVCSARLTVVDTTPPTLQAHALSLWPPNHKLHAFDVADCVSATDSCDGELRGEFIWASSDEPIDDIGDGHHAPDIVLDADCQHASLRAERQGPRDGRVYTLGVAVTDRAGNRSEGQCQVIVDHDQRGITGADSGEAYRVTFDGSQGGPRCDGVPDEVPDADAGLEPPVDAGGPQ